jgi:hypothetical protein
MHALLPPMPPNQLSQSRPAHRAHALIRLREYDPPAAYRQIRLLRTARSACCVPPDPPAAYRLIRLLCTLIH